MVSMCGSDFHVLVVVCGSGCVWGWLCVVVVVCGGGCVWW